VFPMIPPGASLSEAIESEEAAAPGPPPGPRLVRV
jgi:hypothetical protein